MIAVIQAGGKGTRITSITEDKIPKPMLEIDKSPILYHQIMNLKKYNIKEIIIIISHLGNVIKNYFKNGEDFGVKISYVEESPNNPLGTAGALYYIKETIKDDFIFLLGDIFINIDFKRFIAYHKSHRGYVTLLTHPNNHPFDSDLILTKDDLVIGIDYKGNERTSYHNLVNAGVMLFSHHCLDYIKECKKYNYEKDIIFPLIQKEMVYSYKTPEYVKDTGTPERYNQVVADYQHQIPNIKNLSNFQKCIFLNFDSTDLLQSINKLELSSNISRIMKIINESGYLCIFVTNDSNYSFENLNEIYKKLETLLGKNNAYVDDIIHSNNVLTLTNAMKKIIDKYHLDISKSYMISSLNNIIEYAKGIGLQTISLPYSELVNKSEALCNAIMKVIDDNETREFECNNQLKRNRTFNKKKL